jgi:hypothetical protein
MNPGTYPGKAAAAGVQDVHSQETHHFIHYVYNFLKRNNQE